MAEDYYKVLGVDRSASTDEIKRAYRRLAHKHHPDKEGGDEEKFKEVNAAYQVLSDTQKRAQYDQVGQSFEGAGQDFSGFGNFNVNFEDLGGFGDIFEQFFGGQGGGARQRVRRGKDVGVDVTIDFFESAQGVTREISAYMFSTCEHCHGNGAEPGTPLTTCPRCSGAGSVSVQRQTVFGTVAQSMICPDCQGDGKQAKTPCTVCRGNGRVQATRNLDVDIPAGIAEGQTLRITGKGEAPVRGGIPGDLYVTVHVTPHPQLKREGSTVRAAITVSFVEAALGTSVTVPTLQGEQALTIPAG
ncbi:MAG: DnaJ C-terminal domain-containing protein, partial [Candidatus Andersenbacteria bacterium]